MRPDVRVFLDTNVLFAALLSSTGGSRLLLKLAEAGAIGLVVGPRALAEADAVIARKAPGDRPTLALLLDRAGVEIGPAATAADVDVVRPVIASAPDAHIVAEALTAGAHYLVTLDRAHIVAQRGVEALPLVVGTPGDCLAWLRARWTAEP